MKYIISQTRNNEKVFKNNDLKKITDIPEKIFNNLACDLPGCQERLVDFYRFWGVFLRLTYKFV